MSTATYTRLAASALALISQYGRTVSFRRGSATLPDPAKPWEPAQPDGAGAVSIQAQAIEGSRLRDQDGGLSERSKQTLYVAADGLTEAPTTEHRLHETGDAVGAGRAVVAVEAVQPGLVVLLYIVEVEA